MTAATEHVRRRSRRADRGLAAAMLAPTMILLGALILVPVGYSVYLALYKWQLTDINSPKPFVGWSNFSHLFSDSTLRTALRNTVVYVVGCVSVELVVGFAVAVGLFGITKGRRLAHSLILLPMIVAPVITSLLWRYPPDPHCGLINHMVRLVARHR